MTAEDEAALERCLADPVWRLTSGELYKIRTADGRGVIPFTPRKEQVELLMQLLASLDSIKSGNGCRQFVKLKARRLGFSTAIGVFIADCLAFRASFTASLIDQTGDDATKKMNGIVKVALNSLVEIVPMKILKSNDSELSVTHPDDVKGAEVSTFFAGTKARGGSNTFLWASELGVIQFDDPNRASEIVTGAFPSARHGVIFVETTWKGGQAGALHDIIRPTLSREANDWDVSFSPWYLDPRNTSDDAAIDAAGEAYFAKIAPRLIAGGVEITEPQKRWWCKERRTLGIFMLQENPTFLDECWQSAIKGAVYAGEIDRARTEGRVCSFPPDGSSLVNTSWDLGSPANTVVWYWQIAGREIRVIDCDIGDKGTITQRVAHMLAKGYAYGKHYLPHDSLQTERSGTTFATELVQHGLPSGSIAVVPRTHDVWIGINHLKELFPSISFREPNCKAALDSLAAYRTKEEGQGALSRNEPVHDSASHTADALRTMAEAHRAGMVKFTFTDAQPRPDWYGGHRVRRGMKPIRVGA